MALGTPEQEVLLRWVNTFPLDFKVESLEDLSDGTVLSKILEDIDPSYVPLTSTSSAPLTPIIDALFRFLKTKCGDIENAKYIPDTASLCAMKRDGSVDHMDELLVAFLIAAISGPERERFVGDLVQFDLKTGKIIQEIIERKWDEVKDIAISSPAIPSDIDLELEFEARHAALLKHKNDLEKEKDRLSQLLKEANNRIERLRDNHDHMQAELLDAKDQLTKLTKDGDTTQVIEHLQKRLHEQDTLIDNLELQCEENRKERVKMTEQASEYLIQIARIQPLMAELKDVKQELNRMGELRQKVINAENKATNLARKLESQQDWQAENDQLTQENEELAARLNDYELLKRENNSLRAGQESYTRLVHTQEADIAESNRQRIIIEEKLAAAEAAVTRLEEFKMHDEKYIKDMEEERTGVVDDLDTSDSPTNTAGLNLEEELQEEKAGTQQSLELSRLRAEIRVLKSNDAGVQEILTLRKLLDEAERAKKQVSEKYQDIYEKYVIQQQQITAILNAATSEGDVAFRDLRKALADITEALRGSERKRLDAEAELENTKRDLVIARTDLSAIPQGDLDALEALKSSQETVTSSLDNELKALQNRYKSLETDFDLQKDQLTDVILAKDDLQKTSVERAKSLALLEEKDNKKENEKLKDSIEEKNRQQLESKDRIIEELKLKLEKAESSASDSAERSALELENANLKRENDLVTAAWYDLTRRLQSNHVMLQRRPEQPRSWINKQRQAVNTTGKR